MAEMGRNRKSIWVFVQIIHFGSQGLLDGDSQFWMFPPPSRCLLPAAVTLGFPEYKLLLSFSRISNTFLGNFKTTAYPPNFMFLVCKRK